MYLSVVMLPKERINHNHSVMSSHLFLQKRRRVEGLKFKVHLSIIDTIKLTQLNEERPNLKNRCYLTHYNRTPKCSSTHVHTL